MRNYEHKQKNQFFTKNTNNEQFSVLVENIKTNTIQQKIRHSQSELKEKNWTTTALAKKRENI